MVSANRWWMALLLLCGCAEPPKPPAAPLAVSPAALAQLYKWGAGPWPVRVAQGLRVAQSEREDELRFQVHYPAAGEAAALPRISDEAFPVLLFSHGNWSNNEKYDQLIRHWASHGYAVVAPLHPDADGGYFNAMIDLFRLGRLGVIQARVGNLAKMLDALAEVEAQLPGLAGRLDAERIAATGHSFGAFNAQQLGGARAFDSAAEVWAPARDGRIKAVVAISPPGPMFDEINEDSWRTMDAPTLMTTGTWDVNAFWPDWRLHKLSFDTAVAGHQYALVVQGADHYLGNLICRPERDEPPQHDALNMVNTLVVAFLDAYLKQSAAAQEFLQSFLRNDPTEGFAVLERR